MKKETKRAAIYIRCSSDDAKKEGYSPQNQEEKIKEFIKTNGYKLDKRHIYKDIGYSGGTEKRPELQRLMTNAKNKEFDLILIYRLDRFFRKLRTLENFLTDLSNYGIGVKSITESWADYSTPSGRMNIQVLGAAAEWQREITLEARNAGMIKAMKEEKWLGPASYGYDIKDQRLKINSEEAKIVKMIYEWLVYEELSEYKIQQRLNSMKIPTKHDNLGKRKPVNKKNWWSKRTLGRILRNEVYSGTFYYRKYLNPNRNLCVKNNLRPKEEWIKIKTPAIISRELFDKAQKQIEKNRENSPRRTKIKYLFQHKISCGHDGRKWQSACRPKQGTWREVRYYFCSGIRKSITSKKCPSSSIAESKIAPVAWDTLVKLLSQPEAMIKALKRYKDQKDQGKATEGRLKQVLRLLKTNKGQQDRLYRAFVYEGVDEAKYRVDLERFKGEENRLLAEKQRLSQVLGSEEEQGKRTESIKELYKKIKGKLELADHDLKYLIIQKLIKGIIIKDEDMDIEFELPTLEFLPYFNLRDRARMDRNL